MVMRLPFSEIICTVVRSRLREVVATKAALSNSCPTSKPARFINYLSMLELPLAVFYVAQFGITKPSRLTVEIRIMNYYLFVFRLMYFSQEKLKYYQI